MPCPREEQQRKRPIIYFAWLLMRLFKSVKVYETENDDEEYWRKFARKNRNVKKKSRPAVGWQNPSVSKRRRTDSGSLSFVSNIESGEIEGFSTDEERDDDLLELDSDTVPRNVLSKPFVKRKYSKRQTLSDKRTSTSGGSSRNVGSVQKVKELWGCDFLAGASELLQYSDPPKGEDEEIDWCASDNEELPQVFCDGSESDDTEISHGQATTKGLNGGPSTSGEVISDFQSEQEISQESLSAEISTPTPTPVSPVVVGTPRTASEWLKQVQQKSPQKSEGGKSTETKGAWMNQCDSAKKKKKFVRSGLAEQLQLIISREKSEKAFWNHQVIDTEKEQAGACLPSDGSVTIQILCDQLQSSLHLTQCRVLCKDSNSPTYPQHRLVFVLFSCETWKQFGLQVGATVNIYPPWQKLDIPGVPYPVLLCTYFCEKQPGNQSPALDDHLIKGSGPVFPLVHTSPSTSTLVQSPKKGFKPSKLLFGSTEDTCTTQKASLTTVALVAPSSSSSRPQVSILTAIESCGGYSGALVSFQCLVQRVYSKRITLARDSKGNDRCHQLLHKDLKSAAKTLDEVVQEEELRWTLLVQDIHGMCAEIQITPKYQDLPDWHCCIRQGEGKVFTFSHVRVQQRTNRARSPGLFSIIQSLWRSSDNTVTRPNRSSQIQESESQAANPSSPPNFCYVLTVQDSSQAVVCQDVDVCSAGLFHKPCTLRTLWDMFHEKKDDPKRYSALCKLLYCRSSAGLASCHHSTFELFVTDSSLLNAADEIVTYVKILGKSCHVLPEELRKNRRNFGSILSAKHLLLKENQELLIADTYSLIRKAVPESTRITHSGCTFHEERILQDAIDSLSNIKPTVLPCLTCNACCSGYIYRVEGVVIGVDEESACCWLVCDMCGNADITVKQRTSPQFFCSSCNITVNSPKTKTHLAVFVKVKSFPQAIVKVTLQQSTVDKLLPVCYQDSDQGYDIEAVLGKQLGPMTCYVIERSEQHDGNSSSFCLEEIQI